MPCTFCGIFGVKPSPGLVYAGIDDGTYPAVSFQNESLLIGYGPMCRYAQDLWLALDLLITENGRKLLKFPHPDQVFSFIAFLIPRLSFEESFSFAIRNILLVRNLTNFKRCVCACAHEQIPVKEVHVYYLETLVGGDVGSDEYVQSVEPAMRSALHKVYPCFIHNICKMTCIVVFFLCIFRGLLVKGCSTDSPSKEVLRNL